MPIVTNVSRRLIHAGDTMLVPGTPVDLSDDMMENSVIQRYMKAGDIQKGEVEVKPEVPQDEDEDETERKPAAQRAHTPAQPAKPAAKA